MDKHEYELKIDEMRVAIIRKNGAEAAKIADEFDWKKEKDANLIVLAADAYELNHDFDKAKELLIMAYEKIPGSKKLAYRLTLLSARTQSFDEAMEFYQDFVEMAPRDTSRYILEYRISKYRGMPVEELIRILEEFVAEDMDERWMYELACLYDQGGFVDKCVELCDEISLWFSTGEYVRKALDIKKKYKPLTKTQEANYNKTDEEENTDPVPMNTDEVPIEAVLKNEADVPEKEEEETPQATIPFTTLKMEEIRKNLREKGIESENVAETETEAEPETEKPVEEPAEEPISNFSTAEINIVSAIPNDDVSVTTKMPDIDIDKIKIETPEILTPTVSEVRAGIAADIAAIMDDTSNEESEPKRVVDTAPIGPDASRIKEEMAAQSMPFVKVSEDKEEAQTEPEVETEVNTEAKQESIPEIDPAEKKKLEEKEKLAERMSMTLDPLFKYDADGQISMSLNKPEVETEKKEITGQLSIEDVLRSLEERGILKSETVNQAVEALDQANQAAKEASIEVAKEEEEKKLNETEIKDIEITDLMDEKELKEHTESMKGFEFTDKIEIPGVAEAEAAEEVDAIAMLLNENKDIPQSDIEFTGEIELERHVSEDGDEMSVLDLSFDAPVKKLHAGLAPDKEPVAPTTANLQELFADLDEATKKELGIVDQPQTDLMQTSKLGNTAEVADEISAAIEKQLSELEGIGTSEPETENAQDSDEDNVKTDSQNKVDAQTEADSLESDETVGSQEESETTEETLTDGYLSKTGEVDLGEALKDITNATGGPVEKEIVPDGVSKEQSLSKTAEILLNTRNLPKLDEEQTEEKEIPKVTVSTNKNIAETKSLNIDKVMVSDEEMIPFDSFKSINGLEQKIKDTVVDLTVRFEPNGNSKNGNIMILGDEKSGKTTLAIELIKLINKKRERTGRRIAKVDSSVLNTRGIRGSMKKLMGSDLIVENAQHLRQTVLEEFVAVAQYYTDDMLIVFEGETSAMKSMRGENIPIQDMFDHLLIIKEYDVKEWVNYAKKYAAEQNCMIDEMGILALYKSIDDFYGKHQGIDQSDVENIIDHAIKKAGSKVTRKLTNLFSGKNDDNGMDILKESDFK